MAKKHTTARSIGALLLLSIVFGVFSVAPSVDSSTYLREASLHSGHVTLAALFQVLMAVAYVGIGIFILASIPHTYRHWAYGFLCFRILAVCLSLIATALLLAIPLVSQSYLTAPVGEAIMHERMGHIMKVSRDFVNHGLMVILLVSGNVLLYWAWMKTRQIPRWLCYWGLCGSALAVLASVLLLFAVIDVISTEYLLLNSALGIQELVLGFWLLIKGWSSRRIALQT